MTNVTSEKMNLVIGRLQGQPWFSNENWNLLIEETTLEVALSMLEKYIENLHQANQQIQDLQLSKDSETLLKIVHKLSSTSELIGLIEFSQKCRNLQKMIKERRITEESEKVLIQIKTEIQNILKNCSH